MAGFYDHDGWRASRNRRAWHAFGPRYTLKSVVTEDGFSVTVSLDKEIIGTFWGSTLNEAAANACRAVAEDVLGRLSTTDRQASAREDPHMPPCGELPALHKRLHTRRPLCR